MKHEADLKDCRFDWQKQFDYLSNENRIIQSQLENLQSRFENRESRPEDIAKISLLNQENAQLKGQISELEDALNQFKRQMLLREDNYNKHFRNGGAGSRVLKVDTAMASAKEVTKWMDTSANKRFSYLKK